MNKKEILLIGDKTTWLSVTESIKSDKLAVTIIEATEEAIEKFHQFNYDIVLLSTGISNEDERKLRKIFTIQNPGLVILKYENEEPGLLNAKLSEAIQNMENQNKPSFSLVDDALKNAGLDISIQ